uniref:Uncharacterized protein n=1 Tax=Amphiprion ocellaris TaxID=80972 RepID=A0AAQ5XVG7_AMPOC
ALMAGACLKQHNLTSPECLTSTVRGSGGSVMLWGAFYWHGLGPPVPLEGKVTANQNNKIKIVDGLV